MKELWYLPLYTVFDLVFIKNLIYKCHYYCYSQFIIINVLREMKSLPKFTLLVTDGRKLHPRKSDSGVGALFCLIFYGLLSKWHNDYQQ